MFTCCHCCWSVIPKPERAVSQKFRAGVEVLGILANYCKSPTVSLGMPKEIVELVLTRLPGQPWGFSLAGGRDKGQSLKVGSVQDESPAESNS